MQSSRMITPSPRTYFGGTVDVLDGEDVSQAIEQHFSQSWNQLSGSDQHVHTLPPVDHDTSLDAEIWA